MKYVFLGSQTEKNYQLIWGIILVKHNGHDSVNNDENYTYVMFSGRNDRKLQYKLFTDNSKNIDVLVSKKVGKGYVAISEDELARLCDNFRSNMFDAVGRIED
jgi:hypothetical protein